MNSVEVLTDARSREVPWPLIVEALRDLMSAGSVDDQGRPWVEVAANLTGYTTSQLWIGIRTYAFIQKFISSHELPAHALGWPMSNLEVVTRIAKANEHRAKKIVCSTDQLTLRNLRSIYDQTKKDPTSKISAMSAGLQSSKSFTDKLFQNLSNKDALQQILGLAQSSSVGHLKIWPGRYPYCHPNFYVDFMSDGKLCLAAFEGLRFFGDVNSQVATKAALKAAVEATFFAQYYLCAPSWVSTNDLVSLREKLGLFNVGVISVGEENVVATAHPLGPSVHDRQSVLLEDCAIRARLGIVL
ncbi:hypothetical protein FV232_24975 [Methylobacterium sp. WL30]|uniref:hypothetical protein n=1 Tax=unclassified Methylobacterium TaxID=2615210 RepID=UPI0011CB895A|nr:MULTISPECIES: hypothetical protein [unclassified Methylobacterium]TXN29600.1 hypothetical protein FV225_20510 [Methylobacterium sp. WL93]TXN44254.1 hypothetical protein FV227_26870 [Methylobacterium sp. WL119]TXN62638.1 hypothetical protein FV232_24975 [Methylobacterium sp. WL30]